MSNSSRPAVAGLLLLATLAACDGREPVAAPAPAPPAQLAQLDCRVTVATGAMRCAAADPGAGEASGLVTGGQGVYVFLQASNHAYNNISEIFSIDVTVQNLIPQALGTTDGVTKDGNAVRVFFHQDPVATDGSGLPVSVANADGTDFFLTAGQEYFFYDELLQTNQTSGAVDWQFNVPVGVATFGFQVFVAAAVQFPSGWVDVTPAADSMVPGAVQPLTATVRNAVGKALPSATVTWGTSDPGVGTVDASGNFTAVAPGSATITATSGVRSGTAAMAVCPDLAVGGVYTAVMPAAASVCFPGGGSGAEYTYMPVNLSAAAALSLTVTGSGIIPVTGPPSPSLQPGGSLLLNRLEDTERRDRIHGEMLERDRSLAQGLLARPGTRVSRGARGGPSRLIVPGTPSVG
ncbi:MAG TPA: Ig-like domain-containing protein, partial [Longimicrobium sp.]|nr:Ig-like domain-containing protein [Longimicrobium sp.]